MKRPRPSDDAPKEAAVPAKADDAFVLPDDVYIYAPCTLTQICEERMNTDVQAVVPPQYLTAAHAHRTVRLRQLWGTDVYTDDSDLLAVLVHTGYVGLHDEGPKPPLLVTLHVCARQANYASTTRHGLCSREFGSDHGGVSYKIERCVQYTGDLAELEPRLSSASSGRNCLPTISLLPPGYPPSALHIMFNLANEPMYKYSLQLIADRGFEPKDWTSTRLRAEALYLESDSTRYELIQKGTARPRGAPDGALYDTYAFAEVLAPHALDADAMKRAGVPLPAEHVRVLHEGLDWEDIAWGRTSVRIRSAEYPLLRMAFVKHAPSAAGAASAE